MNTFSFTPNSFTCNGKTYPATFTMNAAGAVVVHAAGVVQEGKQIHIVFKPDHAAFSAAKAAALESAQPAPAVEEIPAPAPVPEEQQPAEETPAAAEEPAAVEAITAPETAAPAAPEQPAEEIPEGKKTRGPVPEKTFIGDSIQGKGYKIYFDGNTSRTRVIFDADPTAAARAALDKAGFYFSAAMNSWNKKLTFKAYRAALALNAELSALYA